MNTVPCSIADRFPKSADLRRQMYRCSGRADLEAGEMQKTPEVVLVRQIIEQLQEYIAQEQPDFGDGRSVLTLLYEAYIAREESSAVVERFLFFVIR